MMEIENVKLAAYSLPSQSTRTVVWILIGVL